MFITPYFGGCKYTNNFLFINKNIEIQYFEMLITPFLHYTYDLCISFCIFESWRWDRGAGKKPARIFKL